MGFDHLLSLKQQNKSDHNKKQKKKIERELPYFIAITALLATSGFGPYTIFQKMKQNNLLPGIRLEAEKILNRIEMLGVDPLTAMIQAKEKLGSKSFGDFLNGYVSAIQGGGDVGHYLKTKMKGAFDQYAETEKQTISKVKALVESYMTMQIVVLAVYVIVSAVGSDQTDLIGASNINFEYLIIIFPPIVAAIFMVGAYKINQAKIRELEIKKILSLGVPCIVVAIILVSLNIVPQFNVFVVAFSLIAVSVWPALNFKKLYKEGLDAESSTPQILRDIAEARKAGLGPEKCVVRACKREDYRTFNRIANSIANKLEWGIPFASLFSWLEKEVKDFQVLISFKILFEIISAGGGNVETLDSLAITSEKIHHIEKTKRSMLKPYLMIGFMLMGITGFTTLLVMDALTSIQLESETDEAKHSMLKEESKSRFALFSYAVIVQAWLSGLFLGKIITGTYSGGFQHSIILVVISFVGVLLIQYSLFNISTLF